VVRTGDTTAVCGVRGEILMACDAGSHRTRDNTEGRQVGSEAEALDLLVPNVELATGCAPGFVPGLPPSEAAQELSSRIQGVLRSSGLVGDGQLRIWGRRDAGDEEGEGMEETEGEDTDTDNQEVKAFWTLYIDVLFISLDGNAFDAAWASVVAALRNTRLPRARWDADRRQIVCSDRVADAQQLVLDGLPLAVKFAVFPGQTVAAGAQAPQDKWLLLDPDHFEEELCRETASVVLDCTHGKRRILSLEKVGGTALGPGEMRELVGVAERRWGEWVNAISG
jgi:exosome complex component RRP43